MVATKEIINTSKYSNIENITKYVNLLQSHDTKSR